MAAVASWAATAGARWDAYEFEFEIRQSSLSPKLLRPLHPLHYSVVGNIVYKVTTLPALLPALVLMGWTFHVRLQMEWWHIALFVPSVVLASALTFLFGWCVACEDVVSPPVPTTNSRMPKALSRFVELPCGLKRS